MKQAGLTILAILTTAGIAATVSAKRYIVKDGEARAQIVIAEKPTRMQLLAAKELREYIQKISGAELPITLTPMKQLPIKIYVGESEYADALGVTAKRLKYGAYRMKTGDDWMALVGDDADYEPLEPYPRDRGDRERAQREWDEITGDRWRCPAPGKGGYSKSLGVFYWDHAGSFNAVCGFLRSLGVRWYFPGEFGECVPEIKDIALPEVDETARPDYRWRHIGGSAYNFRKTAKQMALWVLRMGCRWEPSIAVHGIDHVIHRESTRNDHPKWYKMENGKRDTVSRGGKPCLSARGLLNSHIDFARAYFDVYDASMCNVMPTDGYVSLCECELCEGKDTRERGYRGALSDYVWDYAEKVAREVYKTDPDKLISCGSYSAFAKPPLKIEKFSPNMVVRMKRNLAASIKESRDPDAWQKVLEDQRKWMDKLTGDKPIRMAYNYSAAGGTGLPIYAPRFIGKAIRSVDGMCESGYIESNPTRSSDVRGGAVPVPLAVNHLNLYTTTRLWWDSDTDVDALLDEYYRKFYGPAAAEMKQFIEYSEENWPAMSKDVTVIDKTLELLEQARQAAGTDGIYARRVALVKEYLAPMKKLREKVVVGRGENPVARAHELGDEVEIKIDGRLDEDFWADAETYEFRDLKTANAPRYATTLRLAWRDDNLYLAVSCRESDTENILVGTEKHDGMNMWNGDVVELELETQNHAYYQIAINPAGVVFDADRFRGLNSMWESDAEIGTHVGDDCWNLEIRIPVADESQEVNLPNSRVSGSKPSKENPWYFNIGRKRVREGDVERSMFSPGGKKGFHDPGKFGKLFVD